MSKSIISLIKGERDKYRSNFHRNPEVITLTVGSATPLIQEIIDTRSQMLSFNELDKLLMKGEVACANQINKGMKCFGILIKVKLS